ncbi:MAG: hypothetical protein WCD89_26735 [Anaerocolumna sp.]
MSYDLGFWNYKNGVYKDNQETYMQLSNKEYVAGIADLPIDEILEHIADEFKDWERCGQYDFESDDRGAFQVMVTKQFVRIDCYGMSKFVMNKFIDILSDYDCPLYDPQVPQRFDKDE